MDSQTSGIIDEGQASAEVDPWEAAFAALDKANTEEPETDTATEPVGGNDTATTGDGGQSAISDNDEQGDSTQPTGESGEQGDLPGENAEPSGSIASDLFSSFDEDFDKYQARIDEETRNQAIDDIAQEFIKRGARHRNGMLGATTEDADIKKYDEDGVPHFYNPETGKEFTGSNPRKEAQDWVDSYNKELAKVFNDACSQYEIKLKQNNEPMLRTRKFAETYKKLDPIRRGMFENVIEDYEVKKDGKVIGYSCDLDKALALVDRQIKMIQGYAKDHGQASAPAPSGPVTDMKTSSGAIPAGDMPAPGSLAEAMERQQDALLEKMKKN